jgi:hypothetical protein
VREEIRAFTLPQEPTLRFLRGVAMQASEEELFREWVESWEQETGQGIPCREAQADGAPCLELGRDCVECEKAFQVWLELRREREGRGDPSG